MLLLSLDSQYKRLKHLQCIQFLSFTTQLKICIEALHIIISILRFSSSPIQRLILLSVFIIISILRRNQSLDICWVKLKGKVRVSQEYIACSDCIALCSLMLAIVWLVLLQYWHTQYTYCIVNLRDHKTAGGLIKIFFPPKTEHIQTLE